MYTNDTIAAIATPAGSAAIGVVRLSGRDAITIAASVFQAQNGSSLAQLSGYRCALGLIMDGERQVDEAVATVFRAPRSYTGEDSVEFSCHGGNFLLAQVLEVCLKAGARPAEPGEFTRRAFLGGKLNLSQAEAVCDLINAHSEGARRAALSARNGALSTAITILVEKLSALSAHFAAWSDYPEEDLESVDPVVVEADLRGSLDSIHTLAETYEKGRLVREGVETAIVGKPNVGKSTLMNLLSGSRRSIVTDIPGTTRDIVQETVQMGDYLLRLLDTAGIRSTDDPIEQQGVALAKEQIQSAQLILAVFDSSIPLDDADQELIKLLREQYAPCIAIINKVDLPSRLDVDAISCYIPTVLYISAASGSGQEELEVQIVRLLGLDTLDTNAPIVANQRQLHCLQLAAQSLEEAQAACLQGYTLDAVNVCIDEALDALLALTGQRATEKVVDEVFARFCVGK